MDIVPRRQWAHRPPRATSVRIPDRLPRRWLHHGAAGTSSIATARAYLNHHLDGNGWNDIGYSWLIAEGKVLEGRGVGRQGAHTAGDNSASYGIVVCGSYGTRAPADRDLDALVWLLRHGHARGWFPQPAFTGGHRDAPGASTSCPGNALWAQIAQINLRARRPAPPSSDTMSIGAFMQTLTEREQKNLKALAGVNAAAVEDWTRQAGASDRELLGRFAKEVRAVGGLNVEALADLTGKLSESDRTALRAFIRALRTETDPETAARVLARLVEET